MYKAKSMPIAKIGQNKLPLKEYKNYDERVIYISDDTNFEILLKNPTQNTVGALIYINSNLLSPNYIILYPGQHLWLDSNPDNGNKLFFETYKIKNTESNKKAIVNNGLIKIEFYNEETYSNQSVTYPLYTDWQLTTQEFVNINEIMSTGGINQQKMFFSNGNVGIGNSPPTYNLEVRSNTNNGDDEIKTGRITENGNSDMKFESVDVVLSTVPFSTYEYHLMPLSSKTHIITVDDYKVYCSSCGRRRRRGENYCPKCGKKF